jgi:hypothetical protein
MEQCHQAILGYIELTNQTLMCKREGLPALRC